MLRTPAMLHPFAPRPAAGASRAFALQCAHVWALANVRKTGYAGISVFASACSLFNHTIRLFVQDKAPMLKSGKISGYSRHKTGERQGTGRQRIVPFFLPARSNSGMTAKTAVLRSEERAFPEVIHTISKACRDLLPPLPPPVRGGGDVAKNIQVRYN